MFELRLGLRMISQYKRSQAARTSGGSLCDGASCENKCTRAKESSAKSAAGQVLDSERFHISAALNRLRAKRPATPLFFANQ